MQDAVLTQRGFLSLSGISKRYGGVRALEGRLRLRARQDPCSAGRERRRQIDADQDHRRRGPARCRRHAIVRELEGAGLTETNIIASALNIDAATAASAAAGAVDA